MIYDTNSPMYQQFLRSSGRRRDDYQKSKTSISNVKNVHKPAGAASTGVLSMKRFFDSFYRKTGIIKDGGQRNIASRVSALAVEGTLCFSLLGTLGVDTTPLVAAAGITGATIGFACKDFGSNFVASIALSGQKALRVGNHVTVGTGTTAVEGRVIDWDTRYLYLRDTRERVISVPNSLLLTSVLTWNNAEKGSQVMREEAIPTKSGLEDKEWKAAADTAATPDASNANKK